MAANNERSITRAVTSGQLIEEGVTTLAQNTFLNDATNAWNLVPETIKSCKTMWSAKKAIKQFVKTLPL